MANSPGALPWIEYWYHAYREPIGIKITATNLPLLRQNLYTARTESMDSDLQELRLVRSPLNPDTEMWIIHAQAIPASAAVPKQRKRLDEDLNDI